MDFRGFQDIINRIEGVINTKIIESTDNKIEEVHILSDTSRAAKQIVRDVESSLLASFDYRIDRKKISIAQIQTEDRKSLIRIKLAGVVMKTFQSTVECSVKLMFKDEEYYVSQVGINTAANRRKIVADATVKAMEKILGQAYIFDIQDVIVTTSNDITFVSVVVNMVISGGEETMVGSAMVKNDINEAISKAALDAVNRRIEKLNR